MFKKTTSSNRNNINRGAGNTRGASASRSTGGAGGAGGARKTQLFYRKEGKEAE